MEHRKLLEKFEEYWFRADRESRRSMVFTKSEVDKLLHIFSAAIDEGRYALALDLALRFFPSDRRYRLLYASRLIENKHWDEAAARLRELKRLYPHDSEVLFLYARYLNRRGMPRKARDLLMSLSPPPDKEEWFFEMSEIYRKTGRTREARRHYRSFLKEKILKIKHLHPVKKRMRLAVYLDFFRNEGLQGAEAVEMAERFLLLDPQNPELWLFAGDVYKENGLLQKALQSYRHAGLLDENYVAVYYKTAEILERSRSPRHLTEAIKIYLKSLQLTPSAYVNRKIGLLFDRLKHPELAEVYFENALYEDPAYLPAWLDLITSLYKQKKYRRAWAKMEEGLEIAGDFLPPRLTGSIRKLMNQAVNPGHLTPDIWKGLMRYKNAFLSYYKATKSGRDETSRN